MLLQLNFHKLNFLCLKLNLIPLQPSHNRIPYSITRIFFYSNFILWWSSYGTEISSLDSSSYGSSTLCVCMCVCVHVSTLYTNPVTEHCQIFSIFKFTRQNIRSHTDHFIYNLQNMWCIYNTTYNSKNQFQDIIVNKINKIIIKDYMTYF